MTETISRLPSESERAQTKKTFKGNKKCCAAVYWKEDTGDCLSAGRLDGSRITAGSFLFFF